MAEAGHSGGKAPTTGLIALAGAVLLAGGTIAYRTLGGGAGEPVQAAPVGRVALEARVRDDPSDVAAWQQLGLLHFDEGRFAEAEQAYAQAAEIDPRNAALWSALGEARVMASERDPMPAAALEAFHTAIRLDPGDPRARYFLAVKKDLDGDHQGAIDDWLALYEDTPPGAPWEADLKRTIEQVGAINNIAVDVRIAALDAQRPAAAMPGTRGPTQEQLAAAASLPPSEQQAMAQGMVARLEARLAQDPQDVDGWIMLVRSRLTLGEEAKARAALDAALKANPGARAQLQDAARQLGVT